MKNDFLREIEEAGTIAILGHINPDGDCIGSTLGLYNYIIANYDKKVQVYLESLPHNFRFLNGADKVRFQPDDSHYDLCIVCDCGSLDRTGMFQKYYDESPRTMCVDHHISNAGFADVCYVDDEACSASEALYKLMEPDKINYYGAECLYLGIVHDTGVFKHSNTTKHAMTVAGDLIEKGARPYYVIDETFYKKTFAQNKLLGIALGNAIQYADGKITLSVLSKEDFKKTGTTKADTDGIVDQLRITEGTETAVFMYQLDDGYKVSLRSNSIVDVSRIAVSHGGGGHIRAAGFSMMGDIREIVSLIVSEICMQLGVQF